MNTAFQAKPSIRRTRSQAKTASYEELTDSISEDSDDEVTEITDGRIMLMNSAHLILI